VPIPGTTKLKRVEENVGPLAVAFTFEDVREIDESTSKIEVQGARYPEKLEHLTGR
jgi:aryl-alcohol dehydrogenase-like predicted oxidoreductase